MDRSHDNMKHNTNHKNTSKKDFVCTYMYAYICKCSYATVWFYFLHVSSSSTLTPIPHPPCSTATFGMQQQSSVKSKPPPKPNNARPGQLLLPHTRPARQSALQSQSPEKSLRSLYWSQCFRNIELTPSISLSRSRSLEIEIDKPSLFNKSFIIGSEAGTCQIWLKPI